MTEENEVAVSQVSEKAPSIKE